MNKAELVEVKEDRLANTAVVVFLGALLMGQSRRLWEGSEGTTELLMFTVPTIGVSDLYPHVWPVLLVVVPGYRVDGNAAPALGTYHHICRRAG